MTLLIVLTCNALYAQADKKYIRQGNRKYGKNNFSESEIAYRKAADTNKNYPDAVFNTGDALYKQNKFEDAGKQFLESANMNEDPEKKSAAMFNLGNSLLKANKLEESIEAYKGSLKLNPESPEAKYNLAYAQDLLKKQQQQQQQQQQNKENQDNKKDQNKKDQKDQKNDQKDQQKDDKQNQDQNQQQDKQTVSKDDAERILNALANEEKNVQEKVKLAKASKEKVRTVKNW
ncbi:MAG: tetratricopeptide repeat protein [Bacteroidales bacterium]|nr:tetratricopeptide repeat protein [Bacteroidales bacterium]